MIKIIIMFLTYSQLSFSKGGESSGVGNGGDLIRDEFFKIGKKVLNSHKFGLSKIHSELKKSGTLEISELYKLLSIKTVQTTNEILKDNRGSVVSAIGAKDSITLYVGNEIPNMSWQYIIEKSKNADRLVMHEILRAANLNDDDFKYTNIVLNKSDRITDPLFHFNWSKKNEEVLKMTLSNSFEAKSLEEELIYFNSAFTNLMEINNLSENEMIFTFAEFSNELLKGKYSNEGNKILVLALRESIRSLLKINQALDNVANQNFNEVKHLKLLLKEYLFLSFSLIQKSSLILNEDNKLGGLKFLNNLQEVLSNFSDDTVEFKILYEPMITFEKMLKENFPSNILEKKSVEIIRLIKNL